MITDEMKQLLLKNMLDYYFMYYGLMNKSLEMRYFDKIN